MSLAAGTFATLSKSANFPSELPQLTSWATADTALRCRVQERELEGIQKLCSTAPCLGWHPAGLAHAGSIQNLYVAIICLPGGLHKLFF